MPDSSRNSQKDDSVAMARVVGLKGATDGRVGGLRGPVKSHSKLLRQRGVRFHFVSARFS